MLETLKFVKGAVARKDLVPSLTHFEIKDGCIKGYNGFLSLRSPINLDITASPKASSFIKAIEACEKETALYMTKGGRLAIKSGSFKAFVDCIDEPFPEAAPQGERIPLRPGLLDAVQKMAPFIAQDASRPWATGILFRGQSAFATNNIIVAEYWLKHSFPVEVNIPSETIRELLRIKKDPIAIQVTKNNITFHYENDRWLFSSLSALDWPNLSPILDNSSTQREFLPGFFDALEKIQPFVEDGDRVYFRENRVQTGATEELGASVEVPGLTSAGCYQVKQLLLLKDLVKTIDLNLYPKPCLFFGEAFRGAIVGMYE